MKVITSIPTFVANNIGEEQLIEELRAIVPEGQWFPKTFGMRLPEDDERVGVVLGKLKAAGMRPWDRKLGRDRVASEFRIERIREYERADLESCDLLQPWPQEIIETIPLGQLGWAIYAGDAARGFTVASDDSRTRS